MAEKGNRCPASNKRPPPPHPPPTMSDIEKAAPENSLIIDVSDNEMEIEIEQVLLDRRLSRRRIFIQSILLKPGLVTSSRFKFLFSFIVHVLLQSKHTILLKMVKI